MPRKGDRFELTTTIPDAVKRTVVEVVEDSDPTTLMAHVRPVEGGAPFIVPTGNLKPVA